MDGFLTHQLILFFTIQLNCIVFCLATLVMSDGWGLCFVLFEIQKLAAGERGGEMRKGGDELSVAVWISNGANLHFFDPLF